MATAFLEVVKRLIGKWSALQIAIAHGMGGPFAREKEEWLCKVVVDFFHTNSDLHPEEVGEYIDDILNNEFDTLIEDGSMEDICLRLTKYFKWYQSNETDKILSDLETIKFEVPMNIPSNRTEDFHTSVPKEQSVCSNNGDMNCENSCSGMTSDVVSQMRDLNLQSEDGDEWMVVNRSNRKGRPK